MSDTAGPESFARAWAHPLARRAFGRYVVRATGMTLCTVPLFVVGGLLSNSSGDAKDGVPGFVPFVFILPGVVMAMLGLLSLLNAIRIVWVLTRRPWRIASASYGLLSTGTGSGQPTLRLAIGQESWTLTLAALRWRWRRFQGPELLVAGRPLRSGVVATPDLRAIAWAGRSPFTAILLRGSRQHRDTAEGGGPTAA